MSRLGQRRLRLPRLASARPAGSRFCSLAPRSGHDLRASEEAYKIMNELVYRILIAAEAEEDLGALRPYDRKRILHAMASQLASTPTETTRNRKRLDPIPSYEDREPLWELRVGDHRVYYTPDDAEMTVRVWGVRRKGRKLTGEVL
jgi:mRNA-degrading endonuclease RelE of RelBE toxin-antitoxin system